MLKFLLPALLILSLEANATTNYENQDCLQVANAAKATMMARQLGNNKERQYVTAYRMSYDKKIIAIQLIDNAFLVKQVAGYSERVKLASAYYEHVLSECIAQ